MPYCLLIKIFLIIFMQFSVLLLLALIIGCSLIVSHFLTSKYVSNGLTFSLLVNGLLGFMSLLSLLSVVLLLLHFIFTIMFLKVHNFENSDVFTAFFNLSYDLNVLFSAVSENQVSLSDSLGQRVSQGVNYILSSVPYTATFTGSFGFSKSNFTDLFCHSGASNKPYYTYLTKNLFADSFDSSLTGYSLDVINSNGLITYCFSSSFQLVLGSFNPVSQHLIDLSINAPVSLDVCSIYESRLSGTYIMGAFGVLVVCVMMAVYLTINYRLVFFLLILLFLFSPIAYAMEGNDGGPTTLAGKVFKFAISPEAFNVGPFTYPFPGKITVLPPKLPVLSSALIDSGVVNGNNLCQRFHSGSLPALSDCLSRVNYFAKWQYSQLVDHQSVNSLAAGTNNIGVRTNGSTGASTSCLIGVILNTKTARSLKPLLAVTALMALYLQTGMTGLFLKTAIIPDSLQLEAFIILLALFSLVSIVYYIRLIRLIRLFWNFPTGQTLGTLIYSIAGSSSIYRATGFSINSSQLNYAPLTFLAACVVALIFLPIFLVKPFVL